MNKIGFDNEKYLKMQSEHIKTRISQFGGKLYMEFGGKLFDDFHASRVLPGFQPDSKVKMLLELKDQVEIVIVINANDIEKNKVRGDLGITYDLDVLRLIDAFRGIGLYVGSVVLTQYTEGSHQADKFKERLEKLDIKVYKSYLIPGYPYDIPIIVSDDGYGKNEYIETSRPLIVVTAPGPGSGKMATCLSQLYHDNKRGIKAGYAKFETFPIWNLPLDHPVNIAYEAATADLKDVNMIDPYHLKAYGITTVNYNRDVEVFPVVNALFEKIYGKSPYQSPTDMGVNMAGNCIIDDEVCREASKEEIVRRYYEALCNNRKGNGSQEEINIIDLLMKRAGISVESRKCVEPAKQKAEETGAPAACIELNDGRIITGKTSSLLGAPAACIINAIKALGHLRDEVPLLSRIIIEPVQKLKTETLGNHNPRLHVDEMLVALSICAATNPTAEVAMRYLDQLRGCQMHSTVILSEIDTSTIKKLGINLTCEPIYRTKKLFHY